MSTLYCRGMIQIIWVSLLVSIPTGAGVALALLGGSISPLVGVAVSASLLGPVVNAVSSECIKSQLCYLCECVLYTTLCYT